MIGLCKGDDGVAFAVAKGLEVEEEVVEAAEDFGCQCW